MATKKVDRALHGPSWIEVIVGAVLSVILGVALGAALLVFKPVKQVRQMPKEIDSSLVYYIQGSRDTSKARQAETKRQAFVAGQSVVVTEEEINALVSAKEAAPVAKKAAEPKAESKADKAGKAAKEVAADMLATGTPTVRIHEGVMQVGVPVTVGLFGLETKAIAFGRGTFVKKDNGFVYEPTELYLGSCPVQRLPVLSGYVRSKFLGSTPIPEDIAAAWQKLANVTVEGNTLKLAMQ